MIGLRFRIGQKAAEALGCFFSTFGKLSEEGEIEYTKICKHRRIKFEDVMLRKGVAEKEATNKNGEVVEKRAERLSNF